MIINRVTRNEIGILYEVLRENEPVFWSKFVLFGQGPTRQAGGYAFVNAAREQRKQAERLRGLVTEVRASV